MSDLETLLRNIHGDIKNLNYQKNVDSIPMSDDLSYDIARSYNLRLFTVPTLIKVLVDSHMIFALEIVKEDRKNKVLKLEGYVVAEGNLIQEIKKPYEDELIRLYSIEFNKKITIEKMIRELVSKIEQFNNTPIGRVTNIILMLEQSGLILERKIMEYGKKWQEKKLQDELSKLDPGLYLINGQNQKTDIKSDKRSPKKRRAVDSSRFNEFKQYSQKHSIEKSLAVYGVDFYTRVCFRDYQFSLIEKLIVDGNIHEKKDLLIIKKYLQKERANSDQDLELQKFAGDINSLEKVINQKLS